MNFGSASQSGEKTEEKKPAFSFGAAVTGSTTQSKPSLSFGSTTKEENKSSSTPAFSFGSKPANDDKKDTPETSNKPEASKPSFSLNLSAGTSEKKDENSTKPFSFGTKTAEKDETKTDKPAFSFGKTTTDTNESKPALSFGGKNENSDKKSTLTFGSQSEKKEDSGAKPAFSFGSKSDKKDEPPKPAFSLGTKTDKTEISESKPGFSFGAKTDKPSTTTDVNKTETPKAGFSLKSDSKADDKSKNFSFGTSKDGKNTSETDKTESAKSNLGTEASSQQKLESKPVEVKPVSLDNKTLDDLVTKWTNQLSSASKHFDQYSKRITDWDRILVDGGKQISQLYTEAVNAEQAQNKIDQSLQYIERQQEELETFLDNYESRTEALLSDILPSNSGVPGNNNDQKRLQAYKTAESLDENLNALSANLSSLIDEVNDVSNTFNNVTSINLNNKDESAQLIKLLNVHLDALKSLDNNALLLENKIDSIQK